MIPKLLCLILLIFATQQQLASLPISSDLVLKLTLSMSKLQDVLQYFGTWQENKYNIYKRVELTKGYLTQLNTELNKYNNVILGSNTSVTGNKNIIIGNYDNITGSNNWVFVSNYTGNINGDLLLGNWRVQLDKDKLILINTRFAISFLFDVKNKNLWPKMQKQKKFCNWSKNMTKVSTPAQTQFGMNTWGQPIGYNQPQPTQNTFGSNLNTYQNFGPGGSSSSWNWGW